MTVSPIKASTAMDDIHQDLLNQFYHFQSWIELYVSSHYFSEMESNSLSNLHRLFRSHHLLNPQSVQKCTRQVLYQLAQTRRLAVSTGGARWKNPNRAQDLLCALAF